jgi:hypothetical protein
MAETARTNFFQTTQPFPTNQSNQLAPFCQIAFHPASPQNWFRFVILPADPNPPHPPKTLHVSNPFAVNPL